MTGSGADRRQRGRARVRAGELVRLAALLAVAALAPVVGDIGSCGQQPKDLDAFKFYSTKDQIDCGRCGECQITTKACDAACAFRSPKTFAPGCYPLIHDGEVCLHALEVASCADYRGYMADEGASTPTECNFCPLDEAP